ncbi:non-homologous end joining protein Ku [Marinobacter fonticola]|uniref:non-homologous end joining protein Ku n=1 Tax=Marinobacter fonticola TaxID=2603215 RepID=UPI0011E79903|nr:Ku protein [Marinobacter fonticola]
MAARAIWKGTVRFKDIAVPVKLYSAVSDRNIHFRLLHGKDHQPVRQAMVNAESGDVVERDSMLRAYRTDEGDEVLLNPDELDELQPEASRDIEIVRFYPPKVIDHRWYDRPYYLGPDGDDEAYAALGEALSKADREGLARWVMRKKEYVGALQLYEGYPMLMTLRYADRVISADQLKAPEGKTLDGRELDMAKELIGMLDASFEPDDYHDEYRERVLEMIERKRKGGKVKKPPARKKEPSEDLSSALEASLKRMKK